MKKLILTVLCFLGFVFLAQAQEETPTEGFLLPRKTTEERTNTANYPTTTAAGIQVFDTDTKSIWIWDGTKWKDLEVNAVPLWKTATEEGADYYAANDIINYASILYKDLTGINADNTPNVDSINWEIVTGSEGGSSTLTSSFTFKSDLFGTYTSPTFNIAEDDNVTGITWDGTHYWVAGDTTNRVYQYTSEWVYTDANFSTAAEVTDLQDITWDGTHLWVLERRNGNGYYSGVYKYTRAGNLMGSFELEEGHYPISMTWDGTNFCFLFALSEIISKYTASGVLLWQEPIEITPDGVAARPTGNLDLRNITWDGSNFWIVEGSNGNIAYEYTTAGAYTGESLDISAQVTTISTMVWNGENFSIMDGSDDKIYEVRDINTLTDNDATGELGTIVSKGTQIKIVGTMSNNGDYTVLSIESDDEIKVVQNFTNETNEATILITDTVEQEESTVPVSKRVGEMVFAKTHAIRSTENGYLAIKPGTVIDGATDYPKWAKMYPEFVSGDDIVFPANVAGIFLRNIGGSNAAGEGFYQTDLIKKHNHSTGTTYPVGTSGTTTDKSKRKAPYFTFSGTNKWSSDTGENVGGSGDKYPKVDGTTLDYKSSHLGHTHVVNNAGGTENRPINRAYQLYTIIDTY